jgi:multiple sugar transport system ATP-binding protein
VGLSASGLDLRLEDAQRAALGASQELVYGLRPEHLSFADAGLPGTLTMIEPTGPETYVLVDTPVGPMTARLPGKVTQRVGEPVFLAWQARDAHVFDARSELRVA